MSPFARRLILAFSIAGLAFSGASAWVHYKLVTEPNYASPCDISAAFNCSQVYMSSYGAIGGVPVALFGFAWFALVALIAWFSRPASTPTASPSGAYIFGLSTIGLAFCLYLAYASFFVLGTGCLLCIGTYVSVLGIFITAGITSSMSVARIPSRLSTDVRAITARPPLLLVALIYLVGSATVMAFFPKETLVSSGSATSSAAAQAPVAKSLEAMFTDAWWKMPRVDVGVPRDGAKVLVVKFIDWQCPSCRAAHYAYKPIFEKFAKSHPGQVKQVIRDFPLTPKCNYAVQQVIHQAACEAAVGARMMRDKGREDEFVDWIFTVPDQQRVTASEFRAKVTSLLGLSEAEFDKQYTTRIEAVKRDIADGVALKVGSTPTYYVNGVIAQGPNARGQLTWLPAELFELALRLELEKPDTK